MSAASVHFDFSQQRVLVTGGTSGIGEACAIAFVEAGARVVISGRNHDRASAIMKRCKGAAGSIAFVAGDISRRKGCNLIVAEAVGIHGGLDVVVNSAGVIYHATAEETTDEQWQQTMKVNLNGVFYVCRAAIPHLRPTSHCLLCQQGRRAADDPCDGA
jgi:NAD(P)-dependent dehydrogenase (short-subunit alcohol dehydrogenase family)